MWIKQLFIRHFCLISILLLFVIDAKSQQLIAIKAERMLDVKKGKILKNVTVVIEDETIKTIKQGDYSMKGEIIDLGDMTLLPGLIDMHTHLTKDYSGEWLIRPVKETPAGVLSFEKSVGAQHYSDEELEAIVEEASSHGLIVAAHAHGTEGIIAAINAIDLLGVNDRGVIAPGYLADIIAVSGNPLIEIKVLEDVKFVMKGGHIYKMP